MSAAQDNGTLSTRTVPKSEVLLSFVKSMIVLPLGPIKASEGKRCKFDRLSEETISSKCEELTEGSHNCCRL